MNSKELKQLVEENLQKLQQMTIPEYTLYRKWVEINTIYKTNEQDIFSLLFEDNDSQLPLREQKVKNNIWKPSNIEDYKNIEPKVISVNNEEKLKIWNILRIFCHRMPWHANPGRLMKFFVVDNKTKKYLGMFSLGSDFISIGGRDNYIGWTQDQKMKNNMLNYTAMASTIAATQPFGYNYLGGKFIALMVCSDVVENFWNNKYKEPLVGITTTSLYGGFSQYNRLAYWRKCKSSEGKVKMEPSEDVYTVMKDWFKKYYPEEYKDVIKGSHPKNSIMCHPKNNVLSCVYKKIGVKPPDNNAPRGVYFCSLYDNTCNFLSMKDHQLGDKKFDNSVGSLTKLWIDKYASKRINKLDGDGNIRDDILFYYDMIGLSWEETKKKYLET